MNEHVIGFGGEREREKKIEETREQINSSGEFVSEITDIFFCLIFRVFSFIIRMCSIDDVDRILVVTTHLIPTCCPFRISCVYLSSKRRKEEEKAMCVCTITRVYCQSVGSSQIS